MAMSRSPVAVKKQAYRTGIPPRTKNAGRWCGQDARDDACAWRMNHGGCGIVGTVPPDSAGSMPLAGRRTHARQ